MLFRVLRTFQSPQLDAFCVVSRVFTCKKQETEVVVCLAPYKGTRTLLFCFCLTKNLQPKRGELLVIVNMPIDIFFKRAGKEDLYFANE